MKIKDIINNKKKLIILSIITIVGIFIFVVSAINVDSMYKNYQKKQIEEKQEQAKIQHKNEQINEVTNNVKNLINDSIKDLKCEVKYDTAYTSDDEVIIKVTLNGQKDVNLNCMYRLTDGSIVFNNQNYVNKELKNYITEEKIAEIRRPIIHDYQDMLYGIGGQNSYWDRIKFPSKEDDYTVQENSDRFFDGDKAYLVAVDSEWVAKDGHSEWKHICLHMEYDKDNKFIDARYGNYDKIDPDKDIKVTMKVKNVVNTSINNSMLIDNNTSDFTMEEARQLILDEDGNRISEIENKGSELSINGVERDTKTISYSWDIPQEEGYCFDIICNNASGGGYFVGKTSKNVYAMPNQGGMSVYQIKNNKVIQTFKCKNTEKSYEWR